MSDNAGLLALSELKKALESLEDRLNNLNDFRNWVIEEIDAFDAECQAAEYTDTGDAWDLFNQIREEAKKLDRKEN